MAMTENEKIGNQKQVSNDVSKPKSPWKRPVDKGVDAPVMGGDTWPALSYAQRYKNMDNFAKPAAAANGDNSAVPAANVNPQASAWLQKPHGCGNGKLSNRHGQFRHHKGGSKRNQSGVPSSAAPLQFYLPVAPPEFPPMIPGLPIAFPGYGYQPYLSPFPSAGNQQAFGPRDGILMQQHMGPMPFVRSPILRPGPGFVAGPHFHGAGPMYYRPHPGPLMGPYRPHFVGPSMNPAQPMMHPAQLALRDDIVKQIDYYFSEENLRTDVYLKAQMDDQGWVPISIIAGFNRVKRMNTDIQFILAALRCSKHVEVQGDKVRKRENWSMYVMASVEHAALSSAQAISDKFARSVTKDVKNDGVSEYKIESSYEGINQSASDSKISWEQSMKVVTQKADVKNSSESSGNSLHDDEGQPLVGGCMNLNKRLSPSSSAYLTDFSMINSLFSEPRSVGCSTEGRDALADSGTNLVHLSNDFSNTFLLDEELEMEQKRANKEYHNLVKRMDDEDDETLVNEDDIERLVIVTQNNNLGADGTFKHVSVSISSELASTINDGLYFYEQELKAKRPHGKKNSSSGKPNDRFSRLPSPSANLNSKANESSVEESGTKSQNPGNIRMLNKCSSKQQLMTHKQRFFSSNFMNNGTNSNSNDAISESPPSGSIGFYFRCTPPENHGASKLSASPHGNIAGSSPVGSWPKSLPAFQHPIHQLLEENGFKQQEYPKYRKHCRNDRKKLGAGHSEEMNSLYWFWSYILRGTYVPSMYKEFCELALEDAAAGYFYGLECLFRFYSYRLDKEFRDDLYQDFEQHALDFYKKGNLYGLERYWAFHHYREARDGKDPLKKHPQLDKLFREEFCSLDDFHSAKYKDRTTVNDESSNDRSPNGVADGARAA